MADRLIPDTVKAKILAEALPYIKKFHGSLLVIKYGGNAMTDASLQKQFAGDVALLKLVGFRPVIVHGGGPQINHLLSKINKKGEFIRGIRVTDEETLSVVEMVLGGAVNKEIVSLINLYGAEAIGITGRDGHAIKAKKMLLPDRPNETQVDLGQVGEITEINRRFILNLIYESDLIPVIAPIGVGAKGEAYNINADIVAGELAAALKAKKLIALTNIQGVEDRGGRLLPQLTPEKIAQLIAEGVLKDGMLPKINAALTAIENGVETAHIIDGRVPHALLLELFTDEGIGTAIAAKERAKK